MCDSSVSMIFEAGGQRGCEGIWLVPEVALGHKRGAVEDEFVAG
jgi:hypothetical protein